MGKITPTPTQGQPIDFAYINSIVSSLNELTEQMGSTKSKVIVNGVQLVQQPQIVAKQHPIVHTFKTKNTISPGFFIDFNAQFSTSPVVTATYQPRDADSAKNVSIMITDIKPSGVEVKLISGDDAKNYTVNGYIDIIAIGKPAP